MQHRYANIYIVASTCVSTADVIFVNKGKTLSEIVECGMLESVCFKDTLCAETLI